MTAEDSFMEIVRERLAGHRFMEAQGKDGLFFNKTIVAGETFYVDMRKQPTRMYGYKAMGEDRDAALDQEYVDNALQDVKRDLASIGCDLKEHGFEELPEPKPKEKPEKVTPIIKITMTIPELELLIENTKNIIQGQSGD